MTIPTEQKALVVKERRGAWEVSTISVPRPGPGEVLIRIEAAAINPVDWKLQMTGAVVEVYPAVLGSDSAGVVAELGEGVTSVNVGDRV